METDGDRLTCVGVLDASGPRLFLAGRDLGDFPEAARPWKLLVTFNGLAFDVPVLRRAFPAWRPPLAHVDLCHLWRRLGHPGGLKLLEQVTGVGRPAHLVGVSGADACRLWRAWQETGDADALRLLAEYNLLDAVNLRTLMDLGYNRIVERLRLPARPVRFRARRRPLRPHEAPPRARLSAWAERGGRRVTVALATDAPTPKAGLP